MTNQKIMEKIEQPIEPDWDDNGEEEGYHDCPNCGVEYDEIDYEYQICHLCGFNAIEDDLNDDDDDSSDPNDSRNL